MRGSLQPSSLFTHQVRHYLRMVLWSFTCCLYRICVSYFRARQFSNNCHYLNVWNKDQMTRFSAVQYVVNGVSRCKLIYSLQILCCSTQDERQEERNCWLGFMSVSHYQLWFFLLAACMIHQCFPLKHCETLCSTVMSEWWEYDQWPPFRWPFEPESNNLRASCMLLHVTVNTCLRARPSL